MADQPLIDQPQATAPPLDAEAVRAHRDRARTALEWQRNRYDAFERKAIGVLGFVGVIGALLFSLLSPVSQITGTPHTGAEALLLASAVGIVIAALAALAAQFTRKVAAPFPLTQCRDEWASYKQCRNIEASVVMASEAEMLLGGDYPLRAISDDAGRRGAWFKAAAASLAFTVSCIAALLSLLVVAGR